MVSDIQIFSYVLIFHTNAIFAGRFLFYVGNVALNLLIFFFIKFLSILNIIDDF